MTPSQPLPEIALGIGDYIAGGACTEPFLEQDGALHRRPIVLGEVSTECDPFLAELFPGNAVDPIEWTRAWQALDVDGVCIRTEGLHFDEAAELVATIADMTRLPVAVSGPVGNLRECAKRINNSTLILIGELSNDERGHHAVASSIDHADEPGRFIHVKGRFPESEAFELALGYRRDALAGLGCGAPIIFDVTPVWRNGFSNVDEASIMESQAALAAMLHGADVIIVRCPGAADNARFYGEELAL